MKVLALWEQANGCMNTTNKLGLCLDSSTPSLFVNWIRTHQIVTRKEGGGHGWLTMTREDR
jgi:hypothetical protein